MLNDRFRADGDGVIILVKARFADGLVVDREEYSGASEEGNCDGELGFEVGDDTEGVAFSAGVEDFSKVALIADAVEVDERVRGNSSIKDCDVGVFLSSDNEHPRGTQRRRSGQGTRR